MIDIITCIGLVLGIIITAIGFKKQKKSFKYIGFALIMLCLIYVVPEFFKGFIKGAAAPY